MSEAPTLERLGDFAGRRRYLDADDVAWIMARKRAGLPNQHIAAMGNYALSDVQAVLSEHLPERPTPRRAGLPATVSAEARFLTFGQETQPNYSISFGGRLLVESGRLVRGHVGRLPPPKKHWRVFVSEVARKHRVPLADVLNGSRFREHVYARQEAMWVLHQQNRWGLKQIAEMVGVKDHTTVLFGIRQHEQRRNDPNAKPPSRRRTRREPPKYERGVWRPYRPKP